MKRLSFLFVLTSIAMIVAAQTAGTFSQEGIASWYGEEFAGRPTASGEIFNPTLFTAAHPTLPFGTILTVTNTQNMRQVTVRVNDRGPFVAARIIDLSQAAAEALGIIPYRVAPVLVEMSFDPTLGQAWAAPVSQSPAIVQLTPPPATHQAALPQAGVMFPAPAARIVGGIPPSNSMRLYRIQVGAYSIPRNAVDAFTRLRNAGLNPAYEPNGDFYRVVLAGLRAADIPAIAQTLGNAGFREVIIRAER